MKQNNPLVSIVTICYNLEDQIEKTLNSVLNLDSNFFEYVIIDGGSTDRTLEIIELYKIKFEERSISFRLVSEKDKGIYDAMNKGVKMARGKWVNILTGGDQFHPDFSLNRLFNSPKNNTIYFGKSITYFKGYTKVRYKNFNTDTENWFFNYMPNHQAVFIPEVFFMKNEYDLNLHFSSDTHYLRKAFSELDYVQSDEIVSYFELGGVSNYYGYFRNFRKILSDVNYVEKSGIRNIKSKTKHAIKYFFQILLGRDLYLRFYIKYLLKEE
jgi:glycosyltransferase involved in cell wall biosynthesis